MYQTISKTAKNVLAVLFLSFGRFFGRFGRCLRKSLILLTDFRQTITTKERPKRLKQQVKTAGQKTPFRGFGGRFVVGVQNEALNDFEKEDVIRFTGFDLAAGADETEVFVVYGARRYGKSSFLFIWRVCSIEFLISGGRRYG